MQKFDALWNDAPNGGITIPTLLPDRVLRIRSIAADPDTEGFGLEYEMVLGADARPRGGAPPEEWEPWAARNHWWLLGRDDQGTEYEAPSGVYDPFPNGLSTRGVLDIVPTPPSAATWLDITFQAGTPPDYSDLRSYTIRVILPL